MRDNRGIDRDIGAIPRKFAEVWEAINAMRSERRAAATTITDGDFVVAQGSNIIIEDGGGVLAAEGGTIRAVFINRLVQLRSGALEAAVVFFDATPPQSYTLGIAGDGTTNLDCTHDLVLNPATSSVRIAHATTAAAANAVLDATTKRLSRSTSSRRYKQDEQPVEVDPAAVLALVGKTWRDRAEVEQDRDTTNRYVGFIAEDLHDLGLTEFVVYDDEGRPDAISYDRLSVALLALAKAQQTRLDNIEARLERLET